MVTNSVTLPNGTVVTLNSKRTYTHAVVAYELAWDHSVGEYVDRPTKEQYYDTVITPSWGVANYAGSLALANKAAAALSRRCHRHIQIVEVA
jgi:hypothetical protein